MTPAIRASARAIVWMVRTGPSAQISHAFLDGVGMCRWSRIPPGSPCNYIAAGHRGADAPRALVRGFKLSDLSASGLPFGQICVPCQRAVDASARARVGAGS